MTPGAQTRDDSPVRLNRFIARSGVCSRRKADELIEGGRVKINGQVVRELGTKVSPRDKVEVNGRQIGQIDSVTLILNKPHDTITTVSDDRGRTTVLDLVSRPELRKGLFPVGRLDRDTTGILLLTTDGELANRLMHPRWEIEKIYVATTRKPVSDEEIGQLRAGLKLDDGIAEADEVDFVDGDNRTQVAIQIHEGRNRQVHRMFEAIGHELAGLDRIRYAGLTLKGLKRGRWRRLTDREVDRLRKLVRLS